MSEEFQTLKTEQISPSPYQPRTDSFDSDQLRELASTIASVGILQPLIVRQVSEKEYELIAGERRLRAAKMAGLATVPAIVKSSTDRQSSIAAVVENVQRVDLNSIELAESLKNLSTTLSLTQAELTEEVGMKRSSIANLLRLLSLPQAIKEMVKTNNLSTGHAKVILSLPKEDDQVKLAQMIIRSSLSVRQAEEKAKNMLSRKEKKEGVKAPTRNIFLQQIKEGLQSKLGTRIDFKGNEKKGVIELHYYSLSDLNRLLQELGYIED